MKTITKIKQLLPVALTVCILLPLSAQATWQQAVPLTVNKDVTGTLNQSQKENWYKLTITGNVKARFGFKTDGTLGVYYLTLYNLSDNNSLEERAAKYCNNKADTLTVNDLAAGVYYLKINHSYDQGAYTLSYTETPPIWQNDTEPNDTYNDTGVKTLSDRQPATGHLGYYYRKDASDRDKEDWYRITVSNNGTGNFEFKTDNSLTIYYLTLYSFKNNEIKERNKKYCNNKEDKLIVLNLEAGVYFLKINHSYDQGAYTLTYTAIDNPVQNDTEPNNTYNDAGVVTLFEGLPVTGQLGYTIEGSSDTDKEDWYKVEIKRNVKARFGFKTDGTLGVYYLTLYNLQSDSTIEERAAKYCNNKADTLTVNDLAAGVYYLKINHSYDQGAYTLSYTETPPIWQNDTEPNNNFRDASKTPEAGEEITGHLGYYYRKDASDKDLEDWYKVEIKRNVKARFGFKTDGTLDVYYLTLYNLQSDSTIEERAAKYCNNIADTLTVNDLAAGVYYLKINHSYDQGAYTLALKEYPHPLPDFEAIQDMRTYSFVNNTLYGPIISCNWEFGDGGTSELANPSHVYAEPGVYSVTLKVRNEHGESSLTKKVHVRGIQRIESAIGGAGGKSTVIIYGGEIKPNSIAYLRSSEGTEHAAQHNSLIDEGELQATFDLTNFPEGLHDVIVRTAGESDMVLTEGFTVEPMKAPEMWAEIRGRDRALIGRWQTYTLEYGNKGNVDSKSRILWLITPDTPAEIEFKNIILDNKDFYPANTHALLNNEEVHNYMLIDTIINGVEQHLRVYALMIPTLKANSHEKIEFRIKSETPFELSTFITESFDDGLPASPQQPVRMLTPAEYSSFESCVAAAIARFIRDKALGLALDAIPGASCVVDAVKGISETIMEVKDGKASLGSFTWTVATTAWTCAKDFAPPLKAYKMTCHIVDAIIDVKNNFDANKECEKYKKKKDKNKKVRTVSSFDPNEMIGPNGYGSSNFIEKQLMPYTILFENLKTAAVPAQEVIILDTLDINKFDMSTFRFNAFGFGNNRFNVVQDSSKFVKNIDLRPAKNAILRVSGVLNPGNGAIRWQFITLDPNTMDLTEDPDGGFLPPNITQPEGEGFVSFMVSPKNEVKSGDLLTNKALIFFDTNSPIATNIWSNTIDEEAPISRVISAKEIVMQNGSGVELEIESSDGSGSGTKYYDLYVAKGNHAFEHKLSNLPAGKKVHITLEPGSYQFYSIATDSIGTKENPKSAPEFSLEVTAIEKINADEKGLKLYPNPTSGVIRLEGADGKEIANIYDSTGRLQLTLPLSKEGTLDLSQLANGLYIIESGTLRGRIVKR